MKLSDENLDLIEKLLREGNHKLAKKKIKSIPLKKIPERLAVRLSNLMVRAGELRWSAKLLFPIMFESVNGPTPQVVAQYALTLQQLGAYSAATSLYENTDFATAPEANLYYALALFSKWEYEKSISHLEAYALAPGISEYQRLIGQANLAQAFVATQQMSKAETILLQLEAKAKKENLMALLAYVLDLRAQGYISQKLYKDAKSTLDKSEKLIKGGESRYELMVRFWRTVCELGMNPNKISATDELLKLRLNCVSHGRWSLVRECDFYNSVINKNTNLFFKVYFGTPFPAYRQRLKERFDNEVQIPTNYFWNPTEKEIDPLHTLKVFEGLDVHSGSKLKRGQVLHRLLRTLCSDFYIPFTPESLFFYLFPEEKFNPQTSSKRSRFAALRLQKWFKENSIPLHIRFKEEAFRIFFTAPYQVEVKLNYKENFAFAPEELLVDYLQKHPAHTAQQISQALKLPLRTTQRKLAQLLNNGMVSSEKRGRDVLYRLKSG